MKRSQIRVRFDAKVIASMNQVMSSVLAQFILQRARCSYYSFTRSTVDSVWAAYCSMRRMRRCEQQAAAKHFSTPTNKTPDIDATTSPGNPTFAAFTSANRGW
jgi:hypothetical protein